MVHLVEALQLHCLRLYPCMTREVAQNLVPNRFIPAASAYVRESHHVLGIGMRDENVFFLLFFCVCKCLFPIVVSVTF